MPKLSLHMIVRDEERRLPRCLGSVAKFVDEIVIADTGSVDRTKEVAASYGALVVDCNPETHPDFFFMDTPEAIQAPETARLTYSGSVCLGNFGGARNVALEHSTGDYVLWLDADDVLENGAVLRIAVDDMQRRGADIAWMRYIYGTDLQGRPVCTLWRERIVRRDTASWVNVIHEVMIPKQPGGLALKIESASVRHMREAERGGIVVAQRNYKVLLRHLRANSDDARTLFYFGNEAKHIDVGAALAAYERYVEVSGWPEERAFARCCIGEIYEMRSEFGKAYANYAASVVEPTGVPDGLFGLARCAHYRQDWAEVIRFTEEGFKRGDPETIIMKNPLARTFLPHLCYSEALNRVGRVHDAMESVERALAVIPEDKNLQHNLGVYRRFLADRHRRPNRNKNSSGSLEIVIWTGPAVESWSPKSPNTTGIGGSETACIEIARQLAGLGHLVQVYSECPLEAQGMHEGVTYQHHSNFHGAECDVFISSRQPHVADAPIRADLRLLWAHDIHVGPASPQLHRWLLWFDRFLCLSIWHRAFFLQMYPHLHPSSVLVTRNGIDLARFQEQMPAKLNRLVFSSSANRGLDALLDLMPRIRSEVPNAELHVFYGFESWERSATLSRSQGELDQIARLRRRLAQEPGVVWRGRVDQQTLAREMMLAKVWAYPTAFTETSCVSAMEAQAAGCVPLTSRVAALPETVRWGVLIPGANTDADFQGAFVREAVALLRDDEKRVAVAEAGRAYAARLSWEQLARDWVEMFHMLIGAVARDVTPRYEGMLDKRTPAKAA